MKISPVRLLLKTLLLFLAFNLALGLLGPLPVGKLSIYNSLAPGRERLPFGETPRESYNLSLYDLDAMFASLKLAGSPIAAAGSPKPTDEFRVFVAGDSSVWGVLLRPEQTLAARLNAQNLRSADGRLMRFYNLGYPTLSLTKDAMLLKEARRYQPDLVIWLVTLQSFPRARQLESPLTANNPGPVLALGTCCGLQVRAGDPAFVRADFWQNTLIGQHRPLADWLRLQFYGLMWGATGVDQAYPADYAPAQRDLAADPSFNGWKGPTLPTDELALDALQAGIQAAGAPVLLVNEPILISQGKNSAVRYNFYYPRWAYDQYRAWLGEQCRAQGWRCLDAWDAVPQEQFTNSAIHLTPPGEDLLAEMIARQVEQR